MGWSIGYDENWKRDVGYGVPACCDSPDCFAEINRGLAYVCCDSEPYGGERGCGLYFCRHHRNWDGRCRRCERGRSPYTAKRDHPDWIRHKATDESWAAWRAEDPNWQD